VKGAVSVLRHGYNSEGSTASPFAVALGLITALAAAGQSGSARAEPPAPCAIAVIEVELATGGATLTGRAIALADCQFSASMTVERSGRAGSMKVVQGGSFHLEKGQAAKVATVGLSLSAGDKLDVELVLSSEGHEIAASSLRVGR
jgi:hypothetical protein